MNLRTRLSRFSVASQGLNYKLSLIFALFFLAPIGGFLYFAVKYDILSDQHIPFFFFVLLLFSFIGFFMLRKLFDEVGRIAKTLSKALADDFPQSGTLPPQDELKGIVNSFQAVERELRKSFRHLEKKTSEIATLKELSDLCFMTFNPEDLLYITLERALKLTHADIGSVMILERPKRDAFVIETSIGLGDAAPKGLRIAFADSIAKHAVINKAPLLVEDIESDMRFGRRSRPQYATKSFICMPLKTINDVIGVVTLSRRNYQNGLVRNADVLKRIVKHYCDIWPCSSGFSPMHGDLSLDNMIINSDGVHVIDWEHFVFDSAPWGFDILYLLFESLYFGMRHRHKPTDKEIRIICKYIKRINDHQQLQSDMLKAPLRFIKEFIFANHHLWGEQLASFQMKLPIIAFTSDQITKIDELISSGMA